MATRIRIRFSLARACAAVLAVAIAFTVFRWCWPAAIFLAIEMLIPVFVTPLTVTEALVFVACGLILALLALPPAPVHPRHRPGYVPARGRAAASGPVPSVPPGSP